MMRVNLGCGDMPTQGWRNFDNSPSLRLAKVPFLTECLGALGLLNAPQRKFATFARGARIEYADATRRIPLPDDSVDAIYSSHMLEHLYPEQARSFLREALRTLRRGGIIRLAVPDLEKLAKRYLAHGDADLFMKSSLLADPPRYGLAERLRLLMIGSRHHLWMYDGRSLCRLLTSCGFVEALPMRPGSTGIAEPGALDLSERADESVYVEAEKP
jgi:predicted SAM-dependent methyltransferase